MKVLNRLAFFALPVTALTLIGAATLVAQDKGNAPGGDNKGTDAKTKSIFDTASADKQFSTLAKLITAAGLADTLKQPGEYTVFAPTDAAFEKLGKAKLEEWMKPEKKEELATLLKYHVVKGKNMAEGLAKLNGKSLESLAKAKFDVTVKDKEVLVGAAHVTKSDIACSNGIIHVIDAVMSLPMTKDAPKDKGKEAPKGEKPTGDNKPGGGNR